MSGGFYKNAMSTLKDRFFVVTGILVLSVIISSGIAYFNPDKYESKVEVQIQQQENSCYSFLAIPLKLDVKSTAQYAALLKSKEVLGPVIECENLNVSVQDFILNNLRVKYTRGSDLLQFGVIASSPEQAQRLANKIVDSLKSEDVRLNTLQSTKVMNFFSESMKHIHDSANIDNREVDYKEICVEIEKNKEQAKLKEFMENNRLQITQKPTFSSKAVSPGFMYIIGIGGFIGIIASIVYLIYYGQKKRDKGVMSFFSKQP